MQLELLLSQKFWLLTIEVNAYLVFVVVVVVFYIFERVSRNPCLLGTHCVNRSQQRCLCQKRVLYATMPESTYLYRGGKKGLSQYCLYYYLEHFASTNDGGLYIF